MALTPSLRCRGLRNDFFCNLSDRLAPLFVVEKELPLPPFVESDAQAYLLP